MAFEDLHNTGLSLGLFSHLEQPKKQYFQLDHPRHRKRKAIFYSDKFMNLSLALSSDHQVTNKSSLTFDASKVHGVIFKPDTVLNRQASSIRVVSSISSNVKRDASSEQVKIKIVNRMKPNILSMSHSEETRSGEGEMKIKSVYNSKATSDDQNIEEEEGGPRKKLRLSKQQSLILEDTFKEHITLNPKQKQALAKQLNLRARQVEVWFQNRRARTKLKQTEVECELLKKLCETLTDENRKLRKEVRELNAQNRAAPPFYTQLPAPTLSICPSCERAGEPAVTHRISSKPQFSINTTKKQYYA